MPGSLGHWRWLASWTRDSWSCCECGGSLGLGRHLTGILLRIVLTLVGLIRVLSRGRWALVHGRCWSLAGLREELPDQVLLVDLAHLVPWDLLHQQEL